MRLSEIKPIPISSVLQRNWKADVPSWIAGGICCIPMLFISSWHRWLFFVLGVIVAVATDNWMSRVRQRVRVQDAFTPPPVFPPTITIDVAKRATRWAELIGAGADLSFVMFSYGTCVIVIDDNDDPISVAKVLLKAYGHSVPGTPSADMLIYPLSDSGDLVIGCHHPNILTYVSREEIPGDPTSDSGRTQAAYLGRLNRVLDTFALSAIHSKRLRPEQG